MYLNWYKVEGVDFRNLFFLEKHNLYWLAESMMENRTLSIALKAHPDLLWYFKRLLPQQAAAFQSIADSAADNLSAEEIRNAEVEVMKRINDWIVYIVDPSSYDSLEFTKWDDKELTELACFKDKRVIDLGAGTGRLSFIAAREGATVYAVEPVRTLRIYLKEKAHRLEARKFFVVDGLIEDIPFEEDCADITIAGHTFGDFLEEEYAQMFRVTKDGGKIILCPGNVDKDNEVHAFLVDKGFDWARFEEPGAGYVRKYFMKVSK